MVFCSGLYFALRSGKEHRQLRSQPCQIELVERPGERAYLKYVEDVSKNRAGGIKGRKVKPKVVLHHANVQNPERCFVRLFKRYIQLCPESRPAHAFYLQPAKSPTPTCWYSNNPLGHHTLSKTVARLCENAGIQGYKTNHSLRATAATRLYQSGIDEQLVMERTGHRSLEGVRCYKRTTDMQCEVVSDILNVKKPRVIDSSSTAVAECLGTSHNTEPHLELSSFGTANKENTLPVPGAFYFNSCASVTININSNGSK